MWTEDEKTAIIIALRKALDRIAEHEVRADRRHKGMVDVEEVETLKRIARRALKLVTI
jgi:hypothetical protein